MEVANVTALSDTSASVAFNPTDQNVDSYEIVVAGPAGRTTVTVPGNETSAIVDGLMEKSNYNVTIFAVRDGVRSTTSPSFALSTLPDGK